MKAFAIAAAAVLWMTALPVPATAADDVFFDDFSGTQLDSSKWLIAEKNWGGIVADEDGMPVDYNGGVRAQNVSLSDGRLILTGYGNLYEGNVRGINRDGTERADGKRCGAAIATRDYFGSGSYEIRAKIAPEIGCCSAMWTFEYEYNYRDGNLSEVNHEIDIEFPGRDQYDKPSLNDAYCTTWVTEHDYRTHSVNCGAQADGQFHNYRFDWHTGSDTEKPRVDFYFDDELLYTNEAFIPTNESRFWLGLWFPNGWAGRPDFDTAVFEIDWAKITPFHEPGDTPQHETHASDGWNVPPDLPHGWLLWHSYSNYAAMDSSLFLRAPDGTVQEICGDFIHAMNGSFGRSPNEIVFMAIDRAADEWDIFRRQNGKITNLTQNSGFRNEDPKWSPDGRQIVFKRGRWDSTADDFRYDLALLDPDTGTVTMLTDDAAEQAMPCFSPDGKSVFYTEYSGGIGSVQRMNLSTRKAETIYSETGVNAYYPIASGNLLYFTAWHSAENRCDRILQYDGQRVTEMPFDSPDYDCSDAGPAEDGMFFSSTKNGFYDLYYFDGKKVGSLQEINSSKNELGACYMPPVPGDVNADGICSDADVQVLTDWLLGKKNTVLRDAVAANINDDSFVDVSDLSRVKAISLRDD
ncbi:MAG: family 16 glycosylhydrolase [Oscillospiraceae bacterium]|nr:family 16 glycosylhydrolase [Oscillospiraceae bacterium]